MEKYKVRIKGERALLMNACHLEANTQRSKDYNSEKEAEKAMYRDAKGNIGVPSLCILSCLRESAKNFRVPGRGRKTFKDYIYAGLRIEPEFIPLIAENGYEIDLRPVVVQRSRIMRARPKFNDWCLEFVVEIIDPIVTPDSLKQILEDAGKYNGLLDFRPLFGLFLLEIFKRVENEKR